MHVALRPTQFATVLPVQHLYYLMVIHIQTDIEEQYIQPLLISCITAQLTIMVLSLRTPLITHLSHASVAL